ncbi:hypothetical protein [Acaryochloris marina]|uniref:hypothetical protein n=1 Tax=Acaryochloris marina TaxID=155978 RepID=UPI001BAFE845|nr:hypothetical protein [Acaryochloris marina]QUY41989.1 hypothetical protein I1H34_22690 [Acaryochloris marina S15]
MGTNIDQANRQYGLNRLLAKFTDTTCDGHHGLGPVPVVVAVPLVVLFSIQAV